MLAYSLFAVLILAVLISSAILVVSCRRKREYLDCSESSEGKNEEPGNPSESELHETGLILNETARVFVDKDNRNRAAIFIIKDDKGCIVAVNGRNSELAIALLAGMKDDNLQKAYTKALSLYK